MNCFDDDCTCDCHNDDDEDDNDQSGEDLPDDFVDIHDSITTYFNPASQGQAKRDYAKLLAKGLERIEDTLEGLRGDPGRCYPLDERLRRIVDVSRVRHRQ